MRKMNFNSIPDSKFHEGYAKSNKATIIANWLNLGNIDNLKNKIKRNFFMGFGFGLMVAATAFWLFGSDNKEDAMSLESKYTDAKIIEKAKELGMFFPEETYDEENK